VLLLSRLHPKKSVEVLIDAFLSLVEREEFREWRLVLAGDGPPDYVASLKRKVMDNLASDFVIFSGWLDGEKKAATLANAALLALPSQHENFGLCVMEALAAGVPVLISPNVDLAPEIAAAGAGWISDHSQFEDTLASALRSPAERTIRGRRGRELAKNYSWDRIAQQLRDLYVEIIALGSANVLRSADVPSALPKRETQVKTAGE
jgi:glycosyltransferase involved in cell wall biosynthesis